MREDAADGQQAPDFAVLFAKINEAGQVEYLQASKEISREAETVRMIAEATAEIDQTHLVTYVTAG